MSQDIILKRKLVTQTWLVQGEIATASKRPEINCVLAFLSEYPNSKAKVCSEHLFGDKIGRQVVAQRLLDMAIRLELAESTYGSYRLTDCGQEALDKEQVMVPEDGCWKICVSNDALLPHKLVSIEAHTEPSASMVGLGKNSNNLIARKDRLVPIPPIIKSIANLQAQPIAGGDEVKVNVIENKGENLQDQDNQFQIEWNITRGSISVKKGKEVIHTRNVEPIDRMKVLNLFFDGEGLLNQWDESTETLSVNFNETTDAERISMKRNVKIARPTISPNSSPVSMAAPQSFEPLTLQNLNISADSDTDAYEWALWRLANSINMYASKDKYESWKEKSQAPFARFELSLPSRDELASSLWFESDKLSQANWQVIAANDWNL
ncbi:hypothetical protein [Shewanella spartinae]|uniref:hypothetical protein n=1 Tax=Shewanella spartinae TaxID=2864205 RepID=UPI001C65E0FE|nr:hypothetical protein [Shewanella spartinae]QYJ95708.1 hypothetical protein K0I31_10275 [Shewanella spartinae]